MMFRRRVRVTVRSRTRRATLTVALPTVLVLLSGCSTTGSRRTSVPEPNSPTDLGTSTTTGGSDSPTTDSYGIETPAPGDCNPRQPPTVTPTDEGLEPKSYPTYPETIDEKSAGTFAEAYEHAYRHDEFVFQRANAGYDELQVPLGAVRTFAHRDGFVVRVDGELLFADEEQPDGAGTPAPSGEQPFASWFYLTDQFALRNGFDRGLPEDAEPTFAGAATIACRS